MDRHGPGDRWTAIQVVMMPSQANPIPTALAHPDGAFVAFGTIFGGVILSYIDQAGALAARREVSLRGGHRTALFVTAAIKTVEFKKPVLVGDVVRFDTTVSRIGRTSVTVTIDVHAERHGETIAVTTAEGVFVGLDPAGPDRRPVPLFPEPAAA
jgi:acyl-CoA thioesterase YciA